MSFRSRRSRAALLGLAAVACATAAYAAPLPVTLADPKDAPAYVSACAIDSDSSGVFTPAITVTDRKPSAVVAADVAIDFIDPQGHLAGEVVVSPPYGPQPLPFAPVERAACRVKRAEFVDGSVYAVKDASAGSGLLPAVGVLLGIGAAAVLIGSNHGSKSSGSASGSSPTPTSSSSPASGASASPAPVASVIPLATAKAKPH